MRYQIQTNRRSIYHGIAIFEVEAPSEHEAMAQFALGSKNLVDEHIESTSHFDTEPEIIYCSNEVSLLDLAQQ